MQERSAAGQLDQEVAWEQFRALAVTSPHAGLGELVVRFNLAPGKDRLALAGTIASILALVEWPVAWEDARKRLVDALGALVAETSDIFGKLDLIEDRHIAGSSELSAARDLLRIPCRRDELRVAAQLCVDGNFWCWRAIERTLSQLGEPEGNEAVVATRQRYVVLFTGLGSPSPSGEM